MPLCFCSSFGCADKNPQGSEVDIRTFKQHVRQDRLAKASEARAASDHVVEAQRAEIAEYIGSFAIADKISPPPGTRLWSKQTLGPTEIDEISRHMSSIDLNETHAPSNLHHGSRHIASSLQCEPSRRRKVEILLGRLAEIEHEVGTLSEKTITGLESLKHISGIAPTSFPLGDLYSTCKSLCANLDAVNGKASSVVELKAQIQSRLHPIRDSLKKAKLDWGALRGGATVRDVFDQGVEHKTGQYITL